MYTLLFPVLAMVTSLLFVMIYQASPTDAILQIAFSGFVSVKLCLGNMLVRGHGVKKLKYIAGMPIAMWFIYLVLLSLILGLFSFGEEYPPVQVFAVCMLFGWMSGVLHWTLSGYRETYYFSEYDVVLHFLKKKNYTEAQIQTEIKMLREQGVLPPEKG